jgi:hypothetical protein
VDRPWQGLWCPVPPAGAATNAKKTAQENVVLLQEQDPSLAAEEMWAHATPGPEKGGVLIATPGAGKVLGSDKYWQVSPQALRWPALWGWRRQAQNHRAPRAAAPRAAAPPPPLAQAVIFLVEHNQGGSVGLILNRPTGMVMGRKPGGLPFVIAVRSGPGRAVAAGAAGALQPARCADPGVPLCARSLPAAGRAANDAEHL